MEDKSLIKTAFNHAILVLGYIMLVAWFFQLAHLLFSDEPDSPILAVTIFLLLFVVSAAITSSLVLGKPILLYLDGQKQVALKLFIYTLVFMAIALLLVVLIMAAISALA